MKKKSLTVIDSKMMINVFNHIFETNKKLKTDNSFKIIDVDEFYFDQSYT